MAFTFGLAVTSGGWTSYPSVHRFALLTSVATLVLLCAGALVTGTGSGLAVPDWPLSYGQFFPPMIGGVLFEHGHRLIAGSVALLTVSLALFLWKKEPRRWVRALGALAVLVVFLQASLGGLTVLLRLPTAVSVAHACLAQTFFCITVVISLVTSKSWESCATELLENPKASFPLWVFCVIVTAGFFLQLLFGAIMRHMGAGLAISDFPTIFGGWLPPVWTSQIAIHFAHRMWAFVMVGVVAFLAGRILLKHPEQLDLVATVGVLALMVATQVMLGAMIIWLKRPIWMTTAHLAVGAICLASSLILTCKVAQKKRVFLPAKKLSSQMIPNPGGT